MKKNYKIFQLLLMLCMFTVFTSCKNDKWYEVELDSTPVYELTNLKDVATNKNSDIHKFSVYRVLSDLIIWKNDYQVSSMNKIEFFQESSKLQGEMPDWLQIDTEKEQYLTFSFDEVNTIKEEIVNPETGEKEIKDVTVKRMFVFQGKKELNSSAGFGHLTITDNNGAITEYSAVLSDVLKAAEK